MLSRQYSGMEEGKIHSYLSFFSFHIIRLCLDDLVQDLNIDMMKIRHRPHPHLHTFEFHFRL